MAKIIVGGCSFSDKRYGITPWGEQVAAHFSCNYLHQAASAGSNYRIWRTITNYIRAGDITKDDFIIIQYTLVDRKESWTPHVHTNWELESISEPYDSGTLIRLTPHFDQFAKNKYEHYLAKCHNYFNNHQFNLEQFWNNHFMFAHMCKQLQIPVRYLNTAYDNENRIVDINGTHLLDDADKLLDAGHMNQLGHDCAAQLVISHLVPTIGAS
jgi:hypothetical protein